MRRAIPSRRPARSSPQEDIRRELEAEGVDTAKIDEVVKGGGCTVDISDNKSFDGLEQSFSRACKRMRADGGKAFFERFASTAPKLMFLFLPLMAALRSCSTGNRDGFTPSTWCSSCTTTPSRSCCSARRRS